MLVQIVVHGLPWSVEWQDLKDLAKQYGDVTKADIAKRSDGKSRGFGTVVFKTPEVAQNAIQVRLWTCGLHETALRDFETFQTMRSGECLLEGEEALILGMSATVWQ